MPLRTNSLTKRFGDKLVIDRFDYAFPERGVVALMGPSGCGKTALLRLIAGLERPTGGMVQLPPGAKLSMVFQEDRLLPTLDALHNILAVLGKETVERRQLTMDCLGRVGLREEAHRFPAELSGGMKRRVSIARAIAFGGDILLLDEPFKGLDHKGKNTVMDFVLQGGENHGRLTILVTHDRQEAERADHLLQLDGIPLRIIG